ncbi:Clr5 domain-containing protein [Dactylonectria macrodidyma]|uniref:Clr5 domain-containing protein n=1 Tax=Dactylonectria macrodidyma TaxID=307937 RepID=A0A9P9FT81_9HYPO|nr:Clr5 domain-containing protein [Dactylonectria macrodidyma]
MMAKPWDEHRQVIVRLYIKEGRTLHDVRTIMKAKHGFEASVRSYRQHFDQWRVGKYNCKKRQQRRRESKHSTRPLLPSPPRTPVADAASVAGSTSEAGTLEAASPASVASTAQTSGSGAQQPSPERRPLPSPPAQQQQQPQPFVPPFFESNSAQELAVQNRSSASPKGINAMAPATSVWRDEDIQDMLRGTGMAEGMPVCFNPSSSSTPSTQKPQSMTRSATNASLTLNTRCVVEPAKLPAKYMQHPVSSRPTAGGGWDIARPMTTTAAVAAAAFQLSSPQTDFYRLPYQDRMFALNAMRSPEYQPAQRSPSGAFPRIVQGHLGGHVGRERNVSQRQLTDAQMSFDRLTS